MKALYTAVATATGGRQGHVKSEDGILDLQVRLPKSLGGANNDFTNPEQLFAAGYAACFDSALNRVISLSRTSTQGTSVTAKVSIGQLPGGTFGLEAELAVNISGITLQDAIALANRAHEICPYSNATRNNINVHLTVTNN
ncbi:organic hydroperoxide resistance protein [Rurimicrobium arvi]|uniref:Organic hydroperoxide resistance protein n=1 Tax=Rurimicrobium arvi TaxID=2049916 RepID=A0ABP8MGQ2_9BACT